MQVLTVGWDKKLIEGLCDRIATRSGHSFAHLLHPLYDRATHGATLHGEHIYWFFDDTQARLPPGDRELLAGLETEGVPTIHNMILSDRIVSRLPYADALAYATHLARTLTDVYHRLRPSVVIGGFDGLHGSMGLAVARRLGIPWYTLRFSVLPPGLAGFCENMSPASTIRLPNPPPSAQLNAIAESALLAFESRKINAHAPLTPAFLNPGYILRRIPSQLSALRRTLRRSLGGRYNRYTEDASMYSVSAMLREALRFRRNAWQMPRGWFVDTPPAQPFVFFGLHFQPESSIDVCAHFFSDQLRVVELMSRSVPPTHRLLVKMHKSASAHYSRQQLAAFRRFPGVQLVAPHADARAFIQRAALVFSIQGTIGLEAALMGRPVVSFADSPTKVFPSVSTVGRLADLPELVRAKLAERVPEPAQILTGFADYLAPFRPASLNDWTKRATDDQIGGYVQLFNELEVFLARHRRSDQSPARVPAEL